MPVLLNIEMPKCCDDCPCQYDMMVCQALEGENQFYKDGSYVIDMFKEKLPNCPLKEVK